jgi:hypothetical protein
MAMADRIHGHAAHGADPGGQLRYPDCLRSVPVDSRSKLLTGCPGDLRQAVLDEVDAMHKAGKVRNPIGLLSVLARKAGLGLFAPNYSIRIDMSRPVAERWAEDQRTQRPASLAVEPTTVSELGRRVLSDLRKRLSPDSTMSAHFESLTSPLANAAIAVALNTPF